MARGRPSRLGRTAAVPVVTFRVSADERQGLALEAELAGVSVNELARARTLSPGRVVSTELGERPGTPGRRELQVEYEPVEGSAPGVR